MAIAATPASASDREPLASTPLLNEQFLSDVITATSTAIMRQIADTFWDAAADLTTQLETACARNDPSARKLAAHTLKGAAGNVGGARLAELARQLEDAEPSDAAALVTHLGAIIADTRAALDARLAR